MKAKTTSGGLNAKYTRLIYYRIESYFHSCSHQRERKGLIYYRIESYLVHDPTHLERIRSLLIYYRIESKEIIDELGKQAKEKLIYYRIERREESSQILLPRVANLL